MADYNFGTAKGDIVLNTAQLARAVSALNLVGNKMLLIGAAGVAGFGLAVKASADFEQQMSRFGAVANATNSQMEAIRAKALQLGRDSAYGATEVVSAFAELGYAGVSAKEIINGMGDAVVYLAAAAEIPLKDASTALVNTMRQFNLPAKEAVSTVNSLARAANASTVDMGDLITSLRYAGPVAASMGLKVKDVTEALAILGNEGIRGSTAGTSLRGVMLGLLALSAPAGAALHELGLDTNSVGNNFFTASGKMRSLKEIAEILHGSLGDLGDKIFDTNGKLKSTKDINDLVNSSTTSLTDKVKLEAFAHLFQRRAMASALALARDGAGAFDHLANSQQYNTTAAELMRKKLDNLAGSGKILLASLQTLAITIGSAFQGPLKGFVDGVKDAVNWTAKLPAPVLTVVASILVLISSFLVIGGLMAKFGAAAIQAAVAFKELGQAMNLAYALAVDFVGGLAGLASGVLVLAAGVAAFYVTTQFLNSVFRSGQQAANDQETAFEHLEKQTHDLAHATEFDLVGSFNKVVKATHDLPANIDKVAKEFTGATAGFAIPTKVTAQLKVFKDLLHDSYPQAVLLVGLLKSQGQNVDLLQAELDKYTPKQKKMNDLQDEADKKVQATTGSLEDQVKALDALQDATLAQADKDYAAVQAQQQLQDSLKTLKEKRQAAADAGNSDADANAAATNAMFDTINTAEHAAAAMGAKAEADYKGKDAAEAHARSVYAQISSLKDFEAQLDPNDPMRVFLDQYINQLKDPAANSVHHAGVAVDGLDDALSKLNQMSQKLANIGSGGFIHVQAPEPTGLAAVAAFNEKLKALAGFDQHAAGGAIDGPSFVGEQGVEIFSKKGWITSNKEIGEMISLMSKARLMQKELVTAGAPRAGVGTTQAVISSQQMGQLVEAVRGIDGKTEIYVTEHANSQAAVGLSAARGLRTARYRRKMS